jgi:hypothetical protein
MSLKGKKLQYLKRIINKEGEIRMRNFFLFFTIVVLCAGCQKRDAVVQYNTEYIDSEPIIDSMDVKDSTSQSAHESPKSIQETIENYAATSTLILHGGGRRLLFQIEGNFTGSGNREIIAFYGYNSIIAAFCFVLASSGEEIKNVYYIRYITGEIKEKKEAASGFVETVELGKAIINNDRIIGRVGDFNGNGIEELYLSCLSGMSDSLTFFEFHETEFVNLLELNPAVNAFIYGADPKEKTINIQIQHTRDDVLGLIVNNNSYKWDNTTHRYELFASKSTVKRYRWNWDIEEYEEEEFVE